jgi:capsular polysaccharide transport system permease protein
VRHGWYLDQVYAQALHLQCHTIFYILTAKNTMENAQMTLPNNPPQELPSSGTTRNFRMGRIVSALMLREMASRYGRSPGGYLWAVLEPMGMLVVLAIMFSLLVKNPPMGTSFLLYFAAGLAPFNIFQTISNTVARTLIYSRALLSYPIIRWTDAVIARFLLNLLTGITVSYLMLAMTIATLDAPILLSIPPAMNAMFLAAFLGLGIGTLNCALIGMITIWDKFWAVLTRPLFLASGILIRYEDFPERIQNIIWYNPLIHTVGYMRRGFYPTYEATYVSPTYVIFVALIALFFGVMLLKRFHREILTN